MHADFELGADGAVRPASTGRGGRREGAGRPAGYSPKDQARLENGEDDETISPATRVAWQKTQAVARKADADASLAELNLQIKTKEYLPRAAYREATATLLAELSQGLRSLPDILERKYNLPPATVQAIETDINSALSKIASGLELFVEGDE